MLGLDSRIRLDPAAYQNVDLPQTEKEEVLPQTEKEEPLEMEDVGAHLPNHAHITVPVGVHLHLATQAARSTTVLCMPIPVRMQPTDISYCQSSRLTATATATAQLDGCMQPHRQCLAWIVLADPSFRNGKDALPPGGKERGHPTQRPGTE